MITIYPNKTIGDEIMNRGKHRAKPLGQSFWVYGSYFKHEKITPYPIGKISDDNVEHLIIRDGFSDWGMPRNIEMVKVDPESVSQFSGFKDLRRKEIYEHDILETNNQFSKTWIVGKKDGCFVVYQGNLMSCYLCLSEFLKHHEVEVVGELNAY